MTGKNNLRQNATFEEIATNVDVFMLVWNLKYVRPATELVLKTNLLLYSNHKLKRSPPDAAW
jgi:hypothetical protein